ncbi:ChaB family protein [Leptothermofonsia sp. ETS-13]|uniref:ChaB family protein n=1 Tax=Leptothermofonsia sp. ETS-13 TaxID=3035696 RepID=UPI003BA36B80
MPYKTDRDLPANIRDRLSEAAQNFYRVAFNSALQWYGESLKCIKLPGVRLEISWLA